MGTSQDTYLIFPHSLIEPDSYFCSEEWGEFSEGPTARIYGSSYHGRLLAEPHDVNPYIWQIWMKWCVFLTLQRTGHLITLKRHFFVFSLRMVSPCVLPLILSRRAKDNGKRGKGENRGCNLGYLGCALKLNAQLKLEVLCYVAVVT